MQVSPLQSNDSASPTNGQSALHDLFALTDEQILEIEPEAQNAGVARDPWPLIREEHGVQSAPQTTEQKREEASQAASATTTAVKKIEAPDAATTQHGANKTDHDAQPRVAVPLEPPAWLAAQMKDPWSGQEARDLWNGIQQARLEAAAYRAAFATPEDARALKQIYPGGVSEARAAAERARQLDEIDRAYFTGDTAQRSQLAAMMLREDPAAFREMVFEGLRALEKANVAPRFIGASSTAGAQPEQKDAGSAIGPGHVPPGATPTPEAQRARSEEWVARYASFEKAANEELERSVGAVIERTLAQALPAATRTDGAALAGRLSSAIRQDIEKALQGDRQLGEQVAQILSGRRLDDEARGQVVRLIGERAQQLVPGAAKRVLNDWTQTTLAAHRTQSARADAASARREVAPASTDSRGASLQAGTSTNSGRDPSQGANRSPGRSDVRRVDYRKLSDEQILEM